MTGCIVKVKLKMGHHFAITFRNNVNTSGGTACQYSWCIICTYNLNLAELSHFQKHANTLSETGLRVESEPDPSLCVVAKSNTEHNLSPTEILYYGPHASLMQDSGRPTGQSQFSLPQC